MLEANVTCPCVFCKWEKAKVYPQRIGTYKRTGENWQVVCNKCRARGPLKKTPDDAIRAWSISA